jgi:ribosome-binding factor A
MELGKEPSRRQTQIALLVRSIAQDFFQRESSGASLITITDADVSPDMRHATIKFTVLPESKEAAALDFAKRMRTDLRKLIMKKLQTKVTPFLEMEIDYGDKNRQHITELLLKDKLSHREKTVDIEKEVDNE